MSDAARDQIAALRERMGTAIIGQRDVIGFTASTTLNRSDFGQTSLSGVISDEVTIEFSGEFLQAAE